MNVRRFASAAACVLLGAGVALASPAASQETPDGARWNGARAMADIATQLSFGSRALDTAGHQKAIDFITRSLGKTSATVTLQQWTETSGPGRHRLTNIIARFDPANPRRIIVGTHYDSIVRAYRDRESPNAPMPGANNSASGVALLLETARELGASDAHPAVGVDFIFFDGEEGPISLGAGDPNWVALGSPYFAQHVREFYPKELPRAGVIFDMVCYRDLKLYPETSSLTFAKGQVNEFWTIGKSIAPGIFSTTPTAGPIFDDQTALAQIGIPSFLVIGFDYEPWFNTTKDTIDKCSAPTLEAVGETLVRYVDRASF